MDAIDNSAGVDCSDHEVNIKILLDAIVADGDLTGKQRNELLAEMTDEVADARPARQLRPGAGDHELRRRRPRRWPRCTSGTCAASSRPACSAASSSSLPSIEAFEERARRRRRPDRARVRDPALAHEDRALAGAARLRPPRRPVPRDGARALLPDAACASASPSSSSGTRCGARSSRPGSRTTSSTGPARRFSFRLGDETGAAPDEIARAYTAAREVAGLRELWAEIEALDGKVPAATQTAMLLRSRILLERTTRWLLRHRRRPLDIAETVARYAPGSAALAEALPSLLGPSALEEASGTRAGAHRTSASRPTSPGTSPGCSRSFPRPTWSRSRRRRGSTSPRSPRRTSRSASGSSCNGCATGSSSLPRDTRWAAMARAALRDDVYAEQAGLTAHVVRSGANGQPARELVEAGWQQNAAAVERSRQVLADIRSGGALDLARLSVAVRELRNLIHSSRRGAGAGRAGARRPAGRELMRRPAARRARSAQSVHLPHGPGARTAARLRAPARAEAAADRLRRRGRARGARRDAREALDQEGVEAAGVRARGPDDGPDDARGCRHARQGRRALLEGDAPRPGRPHPSRPSPPSASTRTSSRPRRRGSRARA